ncbi:hypothetical protein BH23BAC4_BH23BAC4_09200 [soil metagenome]
MASLDTLPEVTGKRLDGSEMVLPNDLPAPWNLLVISFTGEQDRLSDQWIALAEGIAENAEGRLASFELPLIGKGFRVFEGLIRASLRWQADRTGEAERTVPLYVDRKDFSKALGIKDRKTVHALLVDNTGTVHWRGSGPLVPEMIAELERKVGESLSGGTRTSGPAQSSRDREPGEGLDMDKHSRANS